MVKEVTTAAAAAMVVDENKVTVLFCCIACKLPALLPPDVVEVVIAEAEDDPTLKMSSTSIGLTSLGLTGIISAETLAEVIPEEESIACSAALDQDLDSEVQVESAGVV